MIGYYFGVFFLSLYFVSDFQEVHQRESSFVSSALVTEVYIFEFEGEVAQLTINS